ncbi:MAG TPA: glycoside hydrolase family 15 protein [Candidatus Dormibacteraeota bacterium]|nr:glycoside hydrolase family 15 protein [Candidatus Dormibacteraeota bacterium]
MRPTERIDGYLPISAYGLIGDCRSAALVGHDGSIDWLCLPRFDKPSIFARILDAGIGGYWHIAPRGPHDVVPRYRDRSNVLQNTFTTRTGRVTVTDFMPVHEKAMSREGAPHAEPRLVRLVECLNGEVLMHNDMMPAPDYARTGSDVFVVDDGLYHADAGDLHICFRSSRPIDTAAQTLSLRAGETVAFELCTDVAGRCDHSEWNVERARELLRETQEFWWRWVTGVRYDGPYQEPVWRSALALKLMTYSPTGAIIAAPTTSLPEMIGGPRNWDYRYTWLRDASMTLFAFFQLGLGDEAHAFFDWLTRTGIGINRHPGLDNLYTLDGGRDGHEHILEHLEGYRMSQPVRVGNAAAQQLQLDVYGEVLDSAYLYARFGGAISRTLWRELRAIVDLAIARWEEPDASIWEVRGTERHFTYSKVMCWVAVDRGLRIAERYRLPHDSVRWRQARQAIHRRVVMHGFSKKCNAFTQAFDTDVLDAAVLRMSQVRFLPDRDPRMLSTVDAIERDLRDGVLVRRYLTEEVDDGVGGDEGAFLMCAFWLADAYAHQGRLEDAQRLFERLLSFSAACGLYSEEADGRTGEMLGNYPQAFTHLALVGAAVNIERLRHRELRPRGLRATSSRRAAR